LVELIGEAVGEIELEEIVLVFRRIHDRSGGSPACRPVVRQ
jgi:hypothetical protein